MTRQYEWKKRYSILIAVSRYEIIPETEQWGPVVDILVESFIRAFIRIVDLGGAKAITRELVDGLAEFNLLGATIKGLIGEKATTSERYVVAFR